MLPVSGPILRPRPLGCPVALIVGGVAFFFCSPMLYYSQYKLAVSMEGVLGVLWVVRDATNRLSIILRRDAMCEWVHCMSLYCLRHPPSPRAWRRLLLVAMLFTVGWLGCVFSCLHWVLNSPVYAESGKSRTLFRVATGIYPVVLEIYLLLFLGPVALTTVLTADLGHELDLGPSQVIFHQDETPLDIVESANISDGQNGNQQEMDEAGGPKLPFSQERQSGGTGSVQDLETNNFWRWARCRQRVLHDLACTANSHVSAMILAFVVLHFYHSAFACSHTIISAINEPNLRWKLAVPVLHIICRNILFILLCWVAQRANSEHTRLSERVQTYLAKSSCTPTAGRREVTREVFITRDSAVGRRIRTSQALDTRGEDSAGLSAMASRSARSLANGQQGNICHRLFNIFERNYLRLLQMEFLGFNVRTRRKRFNILGLFFLDLTFLKTVFGAILTYIVVLYQFGASFSSNKSE
ncbi:uncharacterized protein LOC113216393 isoform X2 [Frankliniella occidentalis]|nr:uncharacterized protein LOC113216393 isoform X2 [Frankliniella occidentalis]